MSDVVLKDVNGEQQAYEGVNAVILNTTDGGEAVYREFQADWNQTDSTQPDYIKNKITKVSELENDSGFATEGYVDAQVANLVNSAPEELNTLGELATAFEENQDIIETLNAAITNKADTDHNHDGAYATPTEVDTKIQTSIAEIVVPTKVSELENDAGYITADDIPEGSGGGTVSSWADLTDKPFETLSMSSEFSFANAESFVTCQILNQLWCKISNLTPSKNQLSQVTINVDGDAMALNQFATLAESDDIIIVSDGGNYTFGIVYTSGTITADYQGVPVTGTVPEVGIYIALRNDPSNYTMTINVEYQEELIFESSIPESIARVSDIPEAPEQVQADWDQTDSTKPDYIKNKPVISADGTASVQPNWNQSDNTQADYIKNRPFYDDNIIYFEYDGVSEPLVKLDVSAVTGYEAYACKISNTPLTKEQLLGSTMTMYQRGDFVPVTITEDIMIDGGNYLIINTDSFYSVFEDTTIQGLPVTTGTWTALVPSMFYVSKIEKNELKQIDEKFIPSMDLSSTELNWYSIQDKPFINEEITEVVLIPEQEVTLSGGGYEYEATEEDYTNWMLDWDKATVIINGTTYTSQSFVATASGITAKIIGNPALYGTGDDNGQPFIMSIIDAGGTFISIGMVDQEIITTSSITCSVTSVIQTGFLKSGYIKEVSWDKISNKPFYEGNVFLFPEQVVDFDSNGQYQFLATKEQYEKWTSDWSEATITVSIGDTTNTFTSTPFEFLLYGELPVKAIGNPVVFGGEDNGQPFGTIIVEMQEGMFYGVSVLTSPAAISVLVSIEAFVVKKIDSKFVSGAGGGLPSVTTNDNGKFLQVVDGAWAAVTITNGNEVAW